jgi:hypothetical protein
MTRAAAAVLRLVARLVPAERRDWAHAAWAEAGEVPAGWRRLQWLAGGLWVAAGQGGIMRRAACWLLFGAAGAGVVRIGWPGAAASPATLVNRVDVVVILVLLAGLPWAVRRVFGPAGRGALARAVRTAGYLAILTLAVVKTSVERFGYPPASGGLYPDVVLWLGEVIFLVVIAAYAIWFLAATARRSPAAPASLAIGTAVGAALGAVTYVRVNLHVTSPRLAAVSTAATVLTWAVLLAAPVAAGLAAARRTSGRRGRLPRADARQGVTAGLSAGAAAALVFAVLGTAAAALLPYRAGLLSWAYPIHHLSHGALYRYEVGVSQNAAVYLFVLLFFPLLGAGLGAWGGLAVAGRPGQRPGGGGGGGRVPPLVPPPGSGLAPPEPESPVSASRPGDHPHPVPVG